MIALVLFFVFFKHLGWLRSATRRLTVIVPPSPRSLLHLSVSVLYFSIMLVCLAHSRLLFCFTMDLISRTHFTAANIAFTFRSSPSVSWPDPITAFVGHTSTLCHYLDDKVVQRRDPSLIGCSISKQTDKIFRRFQEWVEEGELFLRRCPLRLVSSFLLSMRSFWNPSRKNLQNEDFRSVAHCFEPFPSGAVPSHNLGRHVCTFFRAPSGVILRSQHSVRVLVT